MALNYKPNPSAHENKRDPLKPGIYPFKVESAEEKTFSTGTPGLSVKLIVGYQGRDVPCFVNLFYEKAEWKLKTFLDSIGLDYDSPPELFEIEGKLGMAKFKIKDDGYFDVAAFLDPVEQTRHSSGGGQKKPATQVADDDNVPF